MVHIEFCTSIIGISRERNKRELIFLDTFAGSAITLLHDNEVFHFKKMMKSLKKGKISKRSVKDGDLEVLMKRYESALEQLKTCVTSVKKKTKRMRR